MNEVFRSTLEWSEGNRWLHFRRGLELWGICVWGRPTPRELATLPTLWCRRGPARKLLLDVRQLDGFDADCDVLGMDGFACARRALLDASCEVLLITARNAVGVAFEDWASNWLDASRLRAFSELEPALVHALPTLDAYVGVEIEQRLQVAIERSRFVDQVRAALASDLAESRVSRVAARLGLSSRTLQRRLAESGTTFRAELTAARLLAARRHLRGSNSPLTQIAFDVGFASLQTFSRHFRRATGATPSQWRRRPVASDR